MELYNEGADEEEDEMIDLGMHVEGEVLPVVEEEEKDL